MWPLSLVSDIQGDLYHTTRAAFTVWSRLFQPVTSVITFDEANTALADNSAEGGWLGGALDVAIENMGGDGVYNTTDGERGYKGKVLMSSKTETDRTRVEEAGFADLVRIVDFMQKVDGSPVLIYTTDTPDSSLAKDQYYTGRRANECFISVTLWDPYGDGMDAFKYIDISALKVSSKWIYHMDWPHFFWPNDG
ncbi:hypothetical protein I315_03915 [Cryptococcus gattii Ru294]|nr:hypothetical protein I315_03915 [Cryptococcus gattii Ru294]